MPADANDEPRELPPDYAPLEPPGRPYAATLVLRLVRADPWLRRMATRELAAALRLAAEQLEAIEAGK